MAFYGRIEIYRGKSDIYHGEVIFVEEKEIFTVEKLEQPLGKRDLSWMK